MKESTRNRIEELEEKLASMEGKLNNTLLDGYKSNRAHLDEKLYSMEDKLKEALLSGHKSTHDSLEERLSSMEANFKESLMESYKSGLNLVGKQSNELMVLSGSVRNLKFTAGVLVLVQVITTVFLAFG